MNMEDELLGQKELPSMAGYYNPIGLIGVYSQPGVEILLHGSFTGSSEAFWSGATDGLSGSCTRTPHLDPMFLVVVNERNGLIGLLDAIDGNAHLTVPGSRLDDLDVVGWDFHMIRSKLFSRRRIQCCSPHPARISSGYRDKKSSLPIRNVSHGPRRP